MLSTVKRLSIGTLLASSIVAIGAGGASAVAVNSVAVTGTLTADNHYGLFFGNEDGSILNFVGRNEKGPSGSQGGYNWSNAETWNFDINPADYLYIAIWDDKSVDESWVGEFSFSTGQSLLSKAESWEYVITQNSENPGDWGETPALAEINWEIANANWVSPTSRGLNDGTTQPWGRISEVTSTAHFLNTTTNTTGDRSDNNRYTIFRTKISVGDTVGIPTESVPEPASVLGLLVFGACGAGSALKRKQSNA